MSRKKTGGGPKQTINISASSNTPVESPSSTSSDPSTSSAPSTSSSSEVQEEKPAENVNNKPKSNADFRNMFLKK